MLYVAARRARRTACSAAKETLVARTRVEVGPGVKMEVQRFSRKVDMVWVCGCVWVGLKSWQLGVGSLELGRLVWYGDE